MDKKYLYRYGNLDLLNLPKTAFLCSRTIPPGLVLKCYDWAVEQREQGRCVISGFHSPIEKDVLHYLLKGEQPIVVALHRGIGPEIEKKFADQLDKGRMLIISPFARNRTRGGKHEASIRNQLMIDLADNVVIGHVEPGGAISKLLDKSNKNVTFIEQR